jgi:outer membrane lipase/esterase
MLYRVMLLLVLALLPIPPGFVSAAPFTGMYVLGDSLSDQGNLFAATSVLGPPLGRPPIPAADHYFSGRFSNGEVYAGVLAQGLGLSLGPSLAGGNNFAFGGTRTNYNIVEGPTGYPPGAAPWTLDLQRQAFDERADTVGADPHALYVVFSGSNDLGDILRRNPAASFPVTVGGILAVIESFIAAGAETILWLNVPDLGVAPRIAALGPAASAAASGLAQQFNAAMNEALDDVTGARIIRFDTFGFIRDVVAHPAQYGLTDVNGVCFPGFVDPAPGVSECSNPDEFLFWDADHPTRRFHALLAGELLAAVVPAPPSAILVAVGLVAAALAWVRRRGLAEFMFAKRHLARVTAIEAPGPGLACVPQMRAVKKDP